MEGGSGKGRNRAVVAGRNRPEPLSGRNWRAGCRHLGLEHGVPSGVELRVAHSAGHTMRTIIAFASALLSSAALADTVRHVTVPERLWGTWAPSADLCRDSKSTFVVSAKGYVTSQANCAIQWVTETAGSDGPIYSAHMRCASRAEPQETSEVNQIIVSNDRGQLSAGPDFKDLKSYRLCPTN
jgi:hypothetical protein